MKEKTMGKSEDVREWRAVYEKMDSPIEKFQFLCGLKELSWEDCQDAWFESQKLMPEIVAAFDDLHKRFKDQASVIKALIKERDRLKALLECVHCATFKEHEVRVEGLKSDRDTAVKALGDAYKVLSRLNFLNVCEQEGVGPGMPEPKQWIKAFDEAVKVLTEISALGILPVSVEGGDGKNWAKIFCAEGVIYQKQFKTQDEAEAFVEGFYKTRAAIDPDDDFHYAAIDDMPAEEER